jgi:uncharacterized protein YaiE (UPF0345 family)
MSASGLYTTAIACGNLGLLTSRSHSHVDQEDSSVITTSEIQTNEYYDGQVRSLEFENSQGKFTAGVMQVGEWEFHAPTREWMILTRGSWEARLPGADEFVLFAEGESFQIEGGETFAVRTKEESAYICLYT